MIGNAHLVAVTGTNGKTSISSFVAQLARGCGQPAAAVGQRIELDSAVVNRAVVDRGHGGLTAYFEHLAETFGCRVIACEVYSAAIMRGAHAGIAYDCAVFSNLASDHQNVHGSAARYRFDKLKFLAALKPGTPVFIPASARRKRRIVSAAERSGLAPRIVETAVDAGPFSDDFMNQNADLAVAVCAALALPRQKLLQARAVLRKPPGRMVRRRAPNGAEIVVDFAHNPHGLEAALRSLRRRASGRILLILSSKGGWGREKRIRLGEVASAFADRVIITDDDPRAEDAALIRMQLRVSGEFRIVPDRARAILQSIADLGRGDALLIAGRGEDNHFVTAFGRKRHNDLEVVENFLGAVSQCP